MAKDFYRWDTRSWWSWTREGIRENLSNKKPPPNLKAIATDPNTPAADALAAAISDRLVAHAEAIADRLAAPSGAIVDIPSDGRCECAAPKLAAVSRLGYPGVCERCGKMPK